MKKSSHSPRPFRAWSGPPWGLDAARWFGAVATVNAGRSAAAWKENRNYPRIILQERQYAYIKAGWGPGIEDGTRP